MTHSTRHTYSNPDMYYDEFLIPKKSGKFRRICAPSPALLAYQRAVLSAIHQRFQTETIRSGLQHIFHGFLPGRNCVTAATQHIGYQTTIIMDIHNFFDTVSAIRHFYGTSSYRNSYLYHSDGTLAQGFATSPILANLSIVGTVNRINNILSTLVDDFAFTVYADDIQISINTEDHDIINTIMLIVEEEFNEDGFTIHPHKTRVTYAKHGYRKILGIGVGEDHIKPSRKLLRKMRAAAHQNNGPSLGGLTTASRLLLPRAAR